MIVSTRAIQVTRSVLKRNYGISAVVYAKASDPIQQLFVDKVREYASKSKGKVFLDPTPQLEKQYKDELAKARRQYGAEGADMSKFPDFKFTEPQIELDNPSK
ncbi:ATP synthase-coupling factor 6, mitochondrial [Galendromus occidentalis]|uniref:ATP synthase-coupling factor 6, mitochondrial n=1 Tax=Galendromus occidentalis TaxID=34638 RepID=A0AAJ6QTC6_9ACAR|nr:ATP synthase-coupling factor 6, mitochondrial [Galendromus occidentalis]